MQEWKQVIAGIGVVVFLGWSCLWLIMFGPLLQDQEFNDAVAWAHTVGFTNMELVEQYPFGLVKRVDILQRYIVTAQEIGTVPLGKTDCEFGDIAGLSVNQLKEVELACEYNFFRGNQGQFVPYGYLTKAGSLVALVRGFYPGLAMDETDPYWEPYVNFAYEQGITTRQSGPYLSYLITRYELLLQLYRVAQLRQK